MKIYRLIIENILILQDILAFEVTHLMKLQMLTNVNGNPLKFTCYVLWWLSIGKWKEKSSLILFEFITCIDSLLANYPHRDFKIYSRKKNDNNIWDNKAHSLIVKTHLSIIACSVFNI